MSTVTLSFNGQPPKASDIGQLPKSNKPVEGVNYRVLTQKLLRLRSDLPHTWVEMPEDERAKLYRVALKAGTVRPSAFQLLWRVPRVLPTYLHLRRGGQLGDFIDYARTLELLWDDILSLSENDRRAFQKDLAGAVQELRAAEGVKSLRTREEIDEWLGSLL